MSFNNKDIHTNNTQAIPKLARDKNIYDRTRAKNRFMTTSHTPNLVLQSKFLFILP